VRGVAAEVFAEQGVEVEYLVGTMIEIPRAALTACMIAEVAEFFSFERTTHADGFGVSRDDAGKFMPLYTGEELEIWPADPFETLDQEGVASCRVRHRARPQGPSGLKVVSAASTAATREREVLPSRRHGLRVVLALPHPVARSPRPGGDRGARRARAREVTPATDGWDGGP